MLDCFVTSEPYSLFYVNGSFVHSRLHRPNQMHWRHVVFIWKSIMKLHWSKRLIFCCNFSMNPITPCLYFASHTIWMGHFWRHISLCVTSREMLRNITSRHERVESQRRSWMLYSLKWRFNWGGLMLEVKWLAVTQWHLKEWSNLFFFYPCQCLIWICL